VQAAMPSAYRTTPDITSNDFTSRLPLEYCRAANRHPVWIFWQNSVSISEPHGQAWSQRPDPCDYDCDCGAQAREDITTQLQLPATARQTPTPAPDDPPCRTRIGTPQRIVRYRERRTAMTHVQRLREFELACYTRCPNSPSSARAENAGFRARASARNHPSGRR
jgi:hypothetical protein